MVPSVWLSTRQDAPQGEYGVQNQGKENLISIIPDLMALKITARLSKDTADVGHWYSLLQEWGMPTTKPALALTEGSGITCDFTDQRPERKGR